MTLGAYDFVMKPLDVAALRKLVGQAVEVRRLMNVPVSVPGSSSPNDRADRLVGRSPAMQDVYKAVGRVASQNVTVLIRGESGTGKELVARAIYQHSPRSDRPFLAVNCAAIPDALLESELFGHEKGSFTGRRSDGSANSSNATAARCSWTKSAICRCCCRPRCCACCSSSNSSESAAMRRSRPTCGVITATNRDLEQMVAVRRVPRRSVLPPERRHDPPAAVARTHGRCTAPARAFSAPVRRRVGKGRTRHLARDSGRTADLQLARQYPRVAERAATGASEYRWPGALARVLAVIGFAQ